MTLTMPPAATTIAPLVSMTPVRHFQIRVLVWSVFQAHAGERKQAIRQLPRRHETTLLVLTVEYLNMALAEKNKDADVTALFSHLTCH